MLQLHPADLLVIVLYFLAVAWMGWRLSRYQTDSRAYFLGNRNLPWWAVCLSVVATETSVLTFIGVPALAYGSDMQFLMLTIGYLVARVILAVFFLPAYLSEDTYTVYGYLRRRFGPASSRLAALLFFVTQVLGSGVRLYASALVLATILGWQDTFYAVVIMAAVTLVYTWAGGITAVIWTDAVQAGVMLGGGALALILLGGMFPEGLGTVLGQAAAEGKLRVFDFSFSLTDSYTFWSALFGGTFLGMASHGTDQVLAHRLLTCRTLGDGRKALVGSMVVIIPQFLVFLLIGVLLHYFFQSHPPLAPFDNPDRIFPYFIVHHFPPVAAGLVIAAIFAAAMSTLSSGIAALSSSTVMDIIRPLSRSPRPAGDYLKLSRWITLFWGAALTGIALLAGGWGPVLETGLTVASFTYGPLLGMFILGFFTRTRSQRAVVPAALIALALVVLWLRSSVIPWTWYVMIGCLATVVLGLALDHLLPARAENAAESEGSGSR